MRNKCRLRLSNKNTENPMTLFYASFLIKSLNRTKTHYTDTDRDIRSREKHKTHSGAGLPVKSGRTGIPAGAIGPKNHRIFYIQRERER